MNTTGLILLKELVKGFVDEIASDVTEKMGKRHININLDSYVERMMLEMDCCFSRYKCMIVDQILRKIDDELRKK
jgi:hypothetical protein